MKKQLQEHWEKVYNSKETNQLGWYEEIPEQSLNLIKKCCLDKNEIILDVGSGASTLIDNLITMGYKNIIATDISETALSKLKKRLGEETSSSVKFIADNIADSKQIQKLRNIALWHDRAVLHFLTKDDGRKGYLSTLLKVVKKGGYVIIAAFSLEGAEKCSGLDVRRYNQNMIQKFLGSDFKLLEHFSYLYYTPSGNARPYVYTLFKRIK
ncbi:MAG: methyltransferase domain-containing protein [Candidatus Nanoarchaeia archaeon]